MLLLSEMPGLLNVDRISIFRLLESSMGYVLNMYLNIVYILGIRYDGNSIKEIKQCLELKYMVRICSEIVFFVATLPSMFYTTCC